MNLNRLLTTAALLLAGLFATPHAARAAESYDNCAGTISSLPAVITTQGVWCLKQDLATAITSGNAITISANNVTIDCNDFKLGGLAAGSASFAGGVFANGRQNATVRHCNIRGFFRGIELDLGAGHLVEGNRLDNNLSVGISVLGGENNRIRRNAVYDTGGKVGYNDATGITANADITDNIVSGLFAANGGGTLEGIIETGPATRVEGNVVSGFNLTAIENIPVVGAIGIDASEIPMTIANNRVFGADKTVGYGIKGIWDHTDFCTGNTVTGFYYGIYQCNAVGNLLSENTQ